MVEAHDFLGLLHPAIAVFFVFPLIGMVVNFAWQTRQRRFQAAEGNKSKIPPGVGSEHLKLGRWLCASVVGIALLGLAYAIFSKMQEQNVFSQAPGRVAFVGLMFVATIASLGLLYNAQPHQRIWRGVFATLTGMGLIVLGCQPEVYRRGFEWYVSHYYYGMVAALLMLFSQAIVPDIYQDRTNRWRIVHTLLNCFALLLFIGQGFTGTRDLLEIPLGWQEPYIQQLYEKQCMNQSCTVEPVKKQGFLPDSLAIKMSLHS
ncbi:MAG: DUF4079 domain-containing protein [Scytolyngbya sp. HA4215-MV1]|jgi:drug/metabolite transporter (DMT)-like permease|nr:DUF4079 domain-containing protein [Scytolyngbya sp. HA4215-MV1]